MYSYRFQNHTLLRPRDKQVVLKPADGYTLLSPRLLFHVGIPVNIHKQNLGVQVCGFKIILVSTPIHQHV